MLAAAQRHGRPPRSRGAARRADIKRRDTALYQFATAGARQVYLWSLDPFTGEASAHRMASRTVRDYTSLEFTPNYEFLVAGTATGDVCCFLVRRGSRGRWGAALA